jgi:hypothetical protein
MEEPSMPDYATSAANLKLRLDAKAKRTADLEAFFEHVRTSLFTELETANSALAYENAPLIEFTQGWPTGPIVQLTCAGAVCTVTTDPNAPKAPNPANAPIIAAHIVYEAGEKTVTFTILDTESPFVARRISLVPDAEPKTTPQQIAAIIVEELITTAP